MYVTFVHSAVTIVIFFFIYLYFIQQRVEIKIQYTHYFIILTMGL